MDSPPTVVLTNDDGIDAPGIAALHDALQTVADVTVVAPVDNQSGVGRAADREFAVREHDRGYAVTGTPADCVAYGLHVVDDPDFVVAGANDGPNVGADNVGRSGTVGAAAEAAFLGHAGIALSTYDPVEGGLVEFERNAFDATQDVARRLVDAIAPETLTDADAYLSVNVPTETTDDTHLRLTEPVHDYSLRVDESGDGYAVTSAFYDPLRPDRDERVTDPVGTDRRALADGDVSIAPLSTTTNTVDHEPFRSLEERY
ncbi:5'/3'-nucleotidase SurE [Halorubellus sp. JP-L1]|uniref:5'/3'-nucleotidase SurE n=1 Tax=Halorubellus sp. JP-L1 TaxID=2715753 RepID=UPI00140A35CE|nr:5'/3'-nucleotidase SurE [Halorubellus sp. JP-L1]NHN41617.1 5'/3'-nucleotidase SurE [Halorubellus sp. JP-L1]